MTGDTIEIDTRGLDQFIRALKSVPKSRVGILGEKNARDSKGGETNASIGARHEFGKGKKLRSFLRMPLTNYLQKYLDKSDAFDKETLSKVIAEGSLIPWLKKVALTAENVVGDAFKTGGFGEWFPSNMKYKKVQMTLVETQQLRNSITSEVK